MSVSLDYIERCAAETGYAAGTLIERLGYRVQRSADAFAGRKIFAIYPSVLGAEDRVEVDLNYLWRIPLSGIQRVELWQPGELDRPLGGAISTLPSSRGCRSFGISQFRFRVRFFASLRQ